jgi:hypothetical protein
MLQSIANIPLRRLLRWGANLGALLLLVTLIIYLAESELGTLGFATLVAGVIGIGAWVMLAPDEIAAWLSGRQVYYGTGSVLIVVVVSGIAIVGYSIVLDRNILVDLTESQNFTISEPSVIALQEFEATLEQAETRLSQAEGRDITYEARLIGFYTREELRDQRAAEFLLRQFIEESSGKLTLDFIDPDIEPGLAAQFGYEGGVNPLGGPVFLAIYSNTQPGVPVRPPENIGVPDERTVQNALRRIVIDGAYKFYFVTGQEELDTSAENDPGISLIYRTLPGNGVLIDTLNLRDADAVPDDATAIIIPRPLARFSQSNVDKIRAYMDAGGRMFVLSDPPIVDPPIEVGLQNQFLREGSPFSDYLWEEFGVRFQDNLVVDPDVNRAFVPSEFIIAGSGVQVNTSPGSALSGIGQEEVVFNLVRSVEINFSPEPGTAPAGYVRTPLIFAREGAYGETQLESVQRENLSEFDPAVDDESPLVIAATVRRIEEFDQETQPRLVLVGDSDWITNGFLAPEDGTAGVTGNFIIWGRLVDWLIEFSAIAEIDVATRPDLLPLTATEAEQSRIQIITLLVMPALVLVAGALVWGLRQRF